MCLEVCNFCDLLPTDDQDSDSDSDASIQRNRDSMSLASSHSSDEEEEGGVDLWKSAPTKVNLPGVLGFNTWNLSGVVSEDVSHFTFCLR